MSRRGTLGRIARSITSLWLIVSMVLASASGPIQTTTSAARGPGNLGQALATGVAAAFAVAAAVIDRPQTVSAQVVSGSMDAEVGSAQTTLPGACFPYGQYVPLYTFAPGASGQAVLQATVSGYGTGCFGAGPDAHVGIQCPGNNPVTDPTTAWLKRAMAHCGAGAPTGMVNWRTPRARRASTTAQTTHAA